MFAKSLVRFLKIGYCLQVIVRENVSLSLGHQPLVRHLPFVIS